MSLNLVVMTCSDLGLELAVALRAVAGVGSITVVHAPYVTKRRDFQARLRHLYAVEGAPGVGRMVARRVGVGRMARASPPPVVDWRKRAVEAGIAIRTVENFNTPAGVAVLGEIGADLGIVAGTYILKPEAFQAPRLGSINLHSGKAPEYRGAAPVFWELYNGETHVGITVHKVEAKLDAGNIVAQELFPLACDSSVDAMAYIANYRETILRPNGIRLVCQAVAAIIAGRGEGVPQDASKAKTYPSPLYKDKVELQRRIIARSAVSGRLRGVKHVAGRAVFAAGLHRKVFSDRGMIVLFHRVDDRAMGDPISCTVQEFRDFCAFFKKHFEVIGLPEMARRVERGDNLSGTLAITFDDGYLDNAQVAAPILKQHGLTATFFIASGFIESNHRPWWDAKIPFQPEWMSWDMVRQLDRDGFTIGAHTDTHVDLGQVDVATARAEIVRSKQVLEKELGHEVPIFSYPYGRRENIREETRDEVRKAGFEVCVSAFGGCPKPGDDRFHIRRDPISPWYLTPYQFGLEMAVRELKHRLAGRADRIPRQG